MNKSIGIVTTKDIIIRLTGRSGIPKGELKQEMFRLHNSMVGKSKYFKRVENPKTSCGSCIQRVICSIFNWYHYDDSSPTYEEIYFTGKLGLHNIPLYKLK